MTPRPSLILLAALMALAIASDASAQFETPSRAFHNGYVFRLDGKHQNVPCESCHLKGQFKGTPRTCYECHWVRRKDDRFQTRLGIQCELCHTPTSWAAARWDHGAMTGTRLNAAHRAIDCLGCHKSGDVRAAALTCVSCHRKDYDATRSPAHAAAGFPVTCDSCHSAGDATWQSNGGRGFNHSAFFPLVGVHATQLCAACHKNNVYKGTPRDCAGCHQADYNRAQNPNHVTAGFPTTCDSCHKPTDPQWAGGVFNHNQFFALVGVHASQACATCHKNNVYKGTPRTCVGCHQADYNRAQNPNHITAGFPTTCDSCHRATDARWASGTFNHSQFFPLVGVHASQACAACHKNNVYKGTPRDCVGCHRANYNSAQNPNHVAAGFPTTCDSCHRATDSTWQQGTFNHTQFPLSGPHNVSCAQCHTTSGNFAVFSCTVCHDRSSTDGHHRDVSGYRYDSVACYACHPRGSS